MAETLQRNISLKLAIVARRMRKHFDDSIVETGVTRSQWTVIAVVAGCPGATQRVIAEALEISEASAGRLVDRLIAEGMVERRRKEDDKRAHAVFLTAKGEQLTDRLSETASVSEEAAFQNIDESELRKLESVLDRISENLGKDEDSGLASAEQRVAGKKGAAG